MTSANINNAASVDREKLPTIGQRVRSTIIATAVAATFVQDCVLPAEYAIDLC